MTDIIESLDERDDVLKTEYDRHDADGGLVSIEVWHSTDGLQDVFLKAVTGELSSRGIQEYAEEHALVVRKTKCKRLR